MSYDSILQAQKQTAIRFRSEPVSARKKRIRAVKDWILSHTEEIREAVHRDFSKPYAEIDSTDIFPVTSEINHILAHLDDWVKPKKADTPITMMGLKGEIRYEPRGTCLIIAPWNFPFNLSIGPLIPCLAAGNTAVIKPSEITPSTSALVRKMIGEIFPEDEVAVVEGGPEVSTDLLKLPFDHIFFTGSPAIGKIVMRAAAENLSTVTLELGGKSPAIVHHDARLREAAKRIAFGKFLNNGQTCIAPDHLVVHESVADRFLPMLKEEVLALFFSEAPAEQSPDYGRISSEKHFDRLSVYLDDALNNGWNVILGGPRDRNTRFFHPHIITGSNLDTAVMQEEIFGPVLPVIIYSEIQEVTRRLSGMHKPLSLYVFSSDRSFCDELARTTSSGSVGFNECLVQFLHPNLPFGGVNHSGIGNSHGYFGFQAFSNEKSVVRQLPVFGTSHLFHPPYRPWMQKMMGLLFRWF